MPVGRHLAADTQSRTAVRHIANRTSSVVVWALLQLCNLEPT